MAGINKVILVGNLGADPEKKVLPSGEAMVSISVATSETWNDRNTNERKERTEWHRVVIFGRQADVVAQYCRKGSKVYLEGRLQTRKWTDQQGQDRYSTEVVLSGMGSTVQLLDSRSGGGAADFDGGYEQGQGFGQPAGGGYQSQKGGYANQGYSQPAQNFAPAPQGYPQNSQPYPQGQNQWQNNYAQGQSASGSGQGGGYQMPPPAAPHHPSHNAPPAQMPASDYPQSTARTPHKPAPQPPAMDAGFDGDDDLPF